MLPKQREVEVPLLQVLVEIGGQGKPEEIYPLVAKKFPDIRDEDLAETLPSGPNRWTNRVQWARQNLVEKGEMDSPAYGVWRITDKGRERLATVSEGEPGTPVAPESLPSFRELYEDYETSLRARLLESLQNLTPREFEQFAPKLLRAYGFVDLTVTDVSNDGGIDGNGRLRLGLATMRVAFQCKKWQGNVGRPEVDKFRGAIQGEYEQGVFFTTSDFTSAARDASLRRGAVPIVLLNGEGIVELMIEKELGIRRRPLYVYDERPDDFVVSDDD